MILCNIFFPSLLPLSKIRLERQPTLAVGQSGQESLLPAVPLRHQRQDLVDVVHCKHLHRTEKCNVLNCYF